MPNLYRMPAPWGSIVLREQNGEFAGLVPSLDPVEAPSTASQPIADVMSLVEEVLSAPQACSSKTGELLFATQVWRRLPDFTRRVLTIVAAIEPGAWMTYGEVAAAAASPAAARAVGQVLAHNPFPILIGCHRVCGSAERDAFDILKPETFRPQAYFGEARLASIAQWLRLLDLSL